MRFGLPRPDPVRVHALDLVVPLVWIPIYCFFPPVSQVDHPVKETILNLISSLADVLEHFPLFAGSFKRDDSGNPNIHSDNVGADFVYELRNETFPGERVQGLDPRGADIGFPTPGDPLVAVKFTAVCANILIDLATLLTMCYSSHAGHTFCALPLITSLLISPRRWTSYTPTRVASRISLTYRRSQKLGRVNHLCTSTPRHVLCPLSPYWTQSPVSLSSRQTNLLPLPLSQNQLISSKSTRRPKNSPKSKTLSTFLRPLRRLLPSRSSLPLCGKPQSELRFLTYQKVKKSALDWL